MSEMKIYVVRHGLTELNKQGKVNGQIDEPLAPEGMAQVKAAASSLPKTIKMIYTSPLIRTRQTVEILAGKLNLPVLIQEELREIHMGSLAGKSWGEMPAGLELKKKHRKIQFDYRAQGGESAREVKSRLIKFLKKIHGEHKDFEALIVTHGGIIRTLHLLERGMVVDVEQAVENASLLTFDIGKIIKRHESS